MVHSAKLLPLQGEDLLLGSPDSTITRRKQMVVCSVGNFSGQRCTPNAALMLEKDVLMGYTSHTRHNEAVLHSQPNRAVQTGAKCQSCVHSSLSLDSDTETRTSCAGAGFRTCSQLPHKPGPAVCRISRCTDVLSSHRT